MNRDRLNLFFAERIADTRIALDTLASNAALIESVAEAARLTADALAAGGTLFTCGNGGSAAQAAHFSGEFVGPFYNRTRRPLAAIALGFDPSAATAVGNDFGYEEILSRQLEALARENDILWALTTSGNSPNILAVLEVARTKGVRTVLLTGCGGGKARSHADLVLDLGEFPTPRIQELHLVVGHFLCEAAESLLSEHP